MVALPLFFSQKALSEIRSYVLLNLNLNTTGQNNKNIDNNTPTACGSMKCSYIWIACHIYPHLAVLEIVICSDSLSTQRLITD